LILKPSSNIESKAAKLFLENVVKLSS
jgi:hypothetical protein